MAAAAAEWLLHPLPVLESESGHPVPLSAASAAAVGTWAAAAHFAATYGRAAISAYGRAAVSAYGPAAAAAGQGSVDVSTPAPDSISDLEDRPCMPPKCTAAALVALTSAVKTSGVLRSVGNSRTTGSRGVTADRQSIKSGSGLHEAIDSALALLALAASDPVFENSVDRSRSEAVAARDTKNPGVSVAAAAEMLDGVVALAAALPSSCDEAGPTPLIDHIARVCETTVSHTQMAA